VQLLFNVQHDCLTCGCDTSGSTIQLQEQVESDKSVATVSHKDQPWFIINTHAFHNAMHLRRILPPHLTEPAHIYPDRKERHQTIAGELVVTMKKKQEETKRKAAETRAWNKAAKEARNMKNAGETQAATADTMDSRLSDIELDDHWQHGQELTERPLKRSRPGVS
jgi:hypothetical protein